MLRHSRHFNTFLGAVRHYFGLEQLTLAGYLGCSRELLANIEAGRRELTSVATLRLMPLLQLVRDPSTEPEDASLSLAPPNADPLLARINYCRYHAGNLRYKLQALETRLEYARRWQRALPALLAGPPERTRAWLLRRQEQAAADLDGVVAARYHLLRLRIEALETEAAALQRLLPATAPTPPDGAGPAPGSV